VVCNICIRREAQEEPPAEVVAFDVNENTVAVVRVTLLSTVDAVARWNRQYVDPAVYLIRTDFGRLAKRYEAVRNAKLGGAEAEVPLRGERRERSGGRTLQTPGSLENSQRDSARRSGRRAA
jgi:hypothetical protein